MTPQTPKPSTTMGSTTRIARLGGGTPVWLTNGIASRKNPPTRMVRPLPRIAMTADAVTPPERLTGLGFILRADYTGLRVEEMKRVEIVPAAALRRCALLVSAACVLHLTLSFIGFPRLFQEDAAGIGVLLQVIG